jgi:hypothetical protein
MLNILQARYKFNVFLSVSEAEALEDYKKTRRGPLLEKTVANLRFERFLQFLAEGEVHFAGVLRSFKQCFFRFCFAFHSNIYHRA